MRSVSRLVLADDPASGLTSAAVFCFRRYSAARVLFQQFSARGGFDRAYSMGCTAAVPLSVGVLCGRSPRARVQFPYKGTKNFSNMQILNDPLFETSEKNRIFGDFSAFFLQLTIRPLHRFFCIYLLFSFFCRNFASFFVPFHRAIIEPLSSHCRGNDHHIPHICSRWVTIGCKRSLTY